MPSNSSISLVDRAPIVSSSGHPGPPADDALDAFPRLLVESSLDKLLASGIFRRSERHRRFMRHIVNAVFEGRRERLKEVLLGLELFDRKIDRYDPRSDPIVRVEAGRLRGKLARYYQQDGADDPFVFVIPVGSYVPRFKRRDSSSAPSSAVESFVVLPFATGDAHDDIAFSIGLADQLINRLGGVRDVKVVARLSAFKARERNLEIRDIGKLLQVTRVIDGSMQRQGKRMRCIAHVYSARDGVCLWSQSFDSNFDGRDASQDVDRFGFQDHIADAVLAATSPSSVALRSRRSVAMSAIEASVTNRRRARDLCERASYLSRRYDAVNTEKVIDLFEQATALDPGNAQSQVALATAYLHQTTLNKAPGNTMLPKIEAALERALALDPADSDALALRAMIAFRFNHDWRKAERLFRAALRISPHTSSLNYRYAFGLIFNGRFAEGLLHSRLAVELDPFNLGLRAMAAQLLAFSRDYEQAEAEAHNVLDLEPEHFYMNFVLGSIHLYRGQFDAAIARFDGLIALHPDHPVAYLWQAGCLGLQGQIEGGRRALDAFRERYRDRYYPPYGLAVAEFCLGNRAACFAAFERAALEGDSSFCTLPVDPLFEPYHADPAFLALLARHGLRGPLA